MLLAEENEDKVGDTFAASRNPPVTKIEVDDASPLRCRRCSGEGGLLLEDGSCCGWLTCEGDEMELYDLWAPKT